MIDLYDQPSPHEQVPFRLGEARSLLRRKEPRHALELLVPVLTQWHAEESDYKRAAGLAAQAFLALELPREALSLTWYTGDARRGLELAPRVLPLERARTRSLAAATDPRRAAELHRAAAADLTADGLLVRAAIQHERAGDTAVARALWSRLAQQLDGAPEQRYGAGLAHFNVARTTPNEPRAVHLACQRAATRLEEAADRFGAVGQRERAFDCYHVLVAIGQLCGGFEHVLEGAVNVVRILAEDKLPRHAVRWYVHAVKLASDAGEHVAAATLARDLSHYAHRHGDDATERSAMLWQAELWSTAARQLRSRGGSVRLAENALLAAAGAYAELDRHAEAARAFTDLAELDLDEAKQARYRRAAARSRAAPETDPVAIEALGRTFTPPPPVWHDDLVEWENRGSAAEACADVLTDPELQADRVTLRAALYGRLIALAAERQRTGPARERLDARLAEQLGAIGTYAVLPALEHLYRSEHAGVRRAAVASFGRYPYKRSFVTLEAAAEDPDVDVAAAAAAAIQRLRFDHAFDPLARIFRSSASQSARLAALRSLAALDVREAAELVVSVLEHGNRTERSTARAALQQNPSPALLDLTSTRERPRRR